MTGRGAVAFGATALVLAVLTSSLGPVVGPTMSSPAVSIPGTCLPQPAIAGGVAVDPRTGTVYASPGGFGPGVTALGAQTGAVAGATPIDGMAGAMAFDSFTDNLFVGASTSGNVTIVNATTGRVLSTVSLGGFGTAGLAIDPSNGTVYVASLTRGNLTALDGSNGSLLGRVALPTTPDNPFGPASLAFDAATGSLAVTSYGGDLLTIVNATSGNVSAEAVVGIYPEGVAATLDGTRLYAANRYSANVSVVSVGLGAAVGNLSTGAGSEPEDLAVDGALGELFVANDESNNLTVFNVTSGLVVGSLPLDGAPGALSVDATTDRLFVVDASGGAFWTINASSDRLLATSHSPGSYALNISEQGLPDGVPWDALLYQGSRYSCNGLEQGTTSATQEFYLPNGTYGYAVFNVSNFSLSGGTGVSKIAGEPQTVVVHFRRVEAPALFLGYPSVEGYALFGGLLAAAAILTAEIVVLSRSFGRRR